MWVRIFGNESVMRLSQYMGDFQPLAQVKGALGCSFTALMLRRNSATFGAESLGDCMRQMYKVFINDKAVCLTSGYELELLPCNGLYFTYESPEELPFVISLLEETELAGAIIHHPDVELLWADFRAHFRQIDAAGGLVRNPEGALLFIHRLGKWDLPKGKIDPGETPLVAALREVKEECGVSDLKALEPMPSTWHTYRVNGVRYLKRTWWYAMESSDTHLVPQTEEGISAVQWLHPAAIDWSRMPSYGSVMELVNGAVLTDLP
jgi:8-oxo-dGTP pyrophosphatase MutT (NUDIX family)